MRLDRSHDLRIGLNRLVGSLCSVAAVLIVVMTSLILTSPATAIVPDPIVGDWNVTYGNPDVVAMTLSGGVYTETAVTPVQVVGSSCDLPVGTVIATFSSTGGDSYSGQHGLWFTSNCSFAEFTSFTGTLSSNGNTLTGVLGNGEGVTFTRTPPTTSVLIPSTGKTLSGSTTLDASALNATSVEFRLFGGIYGYNAPVICTATPTIYGWLCNWNTATVPNGTYLLASEAFNSAGTAFSSGVSVTVNNPASLVDLTGSFSGTTSWTSGTGGCAFPPAIEQVFDATYPGSSAVGSVTLHLDGCVAPFTYAGTFTITTSVGTLAGNVSGTANGLGGPPPYDFYLTLTVVSGTGAFSGTTGTIDVNIGMVGDGSPSPVTGSVSVP